MKFRKIYSRIKIRMYQEMWQWDPDIDMLVLKFASQQSLHRQKIFCAILNENKNPICDIKQ